MIIKTSVPTTYNLALPSGLITLYNCKFGDGSTSKTFTNAGTVPITLTPPSSPNVSVVAEVWSTQRIQTFIVQLTDDYYVDPYYIKNTPYYVRPQDRQDACPILYSSTTDLTAINSGVLFSDLPVTTFNALDTLEFVYDRESAKLWILSKQAPVSVVATEDWSNDPIVALFNLRDSSDTRFFIFVHSSGTIRKLDTTYTQIATASVGGSVVDAIQFPIASTLTDFVVLGSDGMLYKFNISLTCTLTATSSFVKLLGDTYNKSAPSVIHGLSSLGDLYSISTTLILTKQLSNILTLSDRINSGPEYFWGYSSLYSGFANVLSDGTYPDGQGFTNSFPLEYSSDYSYQRVSDAWSNVYVGVGKTVVSFPSGANPYIRFIDTNSNINYVGRRRLNRATFSTTAGYYTPTLNLLAYSITHHTAALQVVGVNTELGISWPPEIQLTITDYYTGQPITTITDDCVIKIEAANKYLDPSFFLTIGKATQELKLGGRLYIPDVPRLVGTYYGVVANAIQPNVYDVLEQPNVLFIEAPKTESLSVSFENLVNPVQQIGIQPAHSIDAQVVQGTAANPESVYDFVVPLQAAAPETCAVLVYGFEVPLPDPVSDCVYGIAIPKLGTDTTQPVFIDIAEATHIPYTDASAPSGAGIWTDPNSLFDAGLYNGASASLDYEHLTLPINPMYRYYDLFWSKDPMLTALYQDALLYTCPVIPKWYKLTTDITAYFDYGYRCDTWFAADLKSQWFNLSDYSVAVYPSQYLYDFDFYVPVYPSQYLYDFDFYVPVYAQLYREQYAGQIDLLAIQWFPTIPYKTIGLEADWSIYSDWHHELYPNYTVDCEYSVGLDPQVLYHEYYQVELAPRTLIQQAQSIDLYPQTKADLHSYGFELSFNAVNEDKFYIINPTKRTATCTLLPNLVGVPAGYFDTELDALQNAVKVWSMLPDQVFAQKLSNGYWVWTRVPVCDNLCEGSGYDMSGYITGG